MSDPSATHLHYDRRTIVLHWMTAALVVALWLLGQTIDWFPKGTPRVFARSTHISLGVALALVLVARISWRSGGRAVHLPPAGLGWLDKMATVTHWLLYGLLITTVALGVTNAWVRGDTIFNLFKIQSIDPNNKPLKESVEEWHALAANTLLVVALFHAAAGLLHHFVWHDGVLRRMLLTKR
ncbi:MAG: cytochrome b [Caldimonas sp.]